MQDDNNQLNFNVVATTKTSKGGKKGLIIGGVAVLFLAVSVVFGVILVKQQQDLREKAQEALSCPGAEACPVAGTPSLLKSCYSVTSGDVPTEVSCSTIANVGTVTYCGSTQYCCPSLGASWSADLTLCTNPTTTPALTPTLNSADETTPSATPTATATATPTITPESTATATAAPIPVTGTNWPTIVGAGVGILIIVGSVLLVI